MIDSYIKLSETQIETTENDIRTLYKKHLKDIGLKLPKEKSLKWYWLVYLYYFKGELVHKSVITSFCREFKPNCASDQQVRHLASQDGFNVLIKGDYYNDEPMPIGYYCLVNLTKPKNSWKNKQSFRENRVKDDDFEDLKKLYGYCCATCGCKEGKPHRYYDVITQLQKGHMNPNKSLEIDNVIPQCQICNQNLYKNDFIFNEFGTPVAVNNANFITKSTDEVQRQMYDLLKKKFGG